MNKQSVERISEEQLKEYVNSMTQEEFISRASELVSDISTLINRIHDLVNDDCLLAAAIGLSVINVVYSGDSIDIVSLNGSTEDTMHALYCLNQEVRKSITGRKEQKEG